MTGANSRLLRAALLPLFLLGCGGGGAKPVTEDDFCTQLAEAECQVADRCVTSEDACKAQRKTACTTAAAAAKAGGERTFAAANIGGCVNKAKAIYGQTGPITPTQLSDTLDLCNYVFQGKVAKLGNCTVKYDCKDKSNICDKGRCAPKVVKNKGDLCGNPGEICNTGSFCTLVGGTSSCEAKGASGATCSADAPCVENLRCAAGTCTDRVAAQGSCATNDDCATAAPYCDPAAGMRCDPGLSFSASAPACCAYGSTTNCNGGTAGTGGSTGAAGTTGSGGTTGAAGSGGSTGSSGTTGGSGTTGAGGLGVGGVGGLNLDASVD